MLANLSHVHLFNFTTCVKFMVNLEINVIQEEKKNLNLHQDSFHDIFWLTIITNSNYSSQ